MCCEQQTPLKMLARALLPDGITGNLLGYGGTGKLGHVFCAALPHTAGSI